MFKPREELAGEEERVWQDALGAMLEHGASPAEAMDGANLILRAYRRERDARGHDDGAPSAPQSAA